MPDGDKVQAEIGGLFRPIYRQICQGKFPDEELANGTLEPTKKKIQEYGDEALQLLIGLANVGAEVQAHLPLFKHQINKDEIAARVKRLDQEAVMDKRAKNLALRAFHKQMEALFKEDYPQKIDVHTNLLHRYFKEIYRADFEAYVESAPDHYGNADPAAVRARLNRMRPHVDEGLLKMAKQAARHNTVDKLRQPTRFPGKSEDIAGDMGLY